MGAHAPQQQRGAMHTRTGIGLGVFADAGTRTCGGAAASYGYEEVDAQTFADWGLSYLKYDNCNAPKTDM